jgi:hypothetical protein
MFGNMLHLTMTPHDRLHPPQHWESDIHMASRGHRGSCSILTLTRRHRPANPLCCSMGTWTDDRCRHIQLVLVLLYDYLGNLQYCFKFIIDRTRDNIIRADIVCGRLLVWVEAISPRQPLPPNGVNI